MIKRTLNGPISTGSGVIIAAVKGFEEILRDAEFTEVGDHGVYIRGHIPLCFCLRFCCLTVHGRSNHGYESRHQYHTTKHQFQLPGFNAGTLLASRVHQLYHRLG